MRPRLITAENARGLGAVDVAVDASMRPRLITAENEPPGHQGLMLPHASMRPRLITAENEQAGGRLSGRTTRFNEAAAHHRGERLLREVPPRDPPASMRPRLITAENTGGEAGQPA